MAETVSDMQSHYSMKMCPRSRYQWQGQVITFQDICEILLWLVPSLDTWFWHTSPHPWYPAKRAPPAMLTHGRQGPFDRIPLTYDMDKGIKGTDNLYSIWQKHTVHPKNCTHGLHFVFCCSFTLVNTLRPRKNGRHFADDILKCIFLNENVLIPIEI